jgi:ribosomal protein L11 methyltransferase
VTVGTLTVVAVTVPRAEAATRELQELGAREVQSRSPGDDRLLLYGRFNDNTSALLAVAELRRRGWAAAQRPADDDPHLAAWRNRTQPITVGNGRLTVAFPWAEHDRGDALLVEIDPGAAFGGGAHPTTRLLLEELAARLHGGEAVLDVGCGSGVLALAAARLGAASAMGVDVDPAAVVATRANAERNGLADRVVAHSTPLQAVDGTFDVIVANIGLEVLVTLANEMEKRLTAGGWLALSGISPGQVSHLVAASSSIRVVATPQLDDWCALVGEAPGPAVP